MTTQGHRSQHDHFTLKGHWWLPQACRKVAGDLTYTEGDLILSLYGGLSDVTLKSPFSGEIDEPEHSLVHGETDDNVPITLVHTFYTGWTPNITMSSARPGSTVGVRASQLHCRMMVKGLHLSSAQDTFAKCRIEIPQLDVWLGVKPFNLVTKDSCRSMSLNYELPENRHFYLEAPACRVSFIHAVTSPGSPYGRSPRILHRTVLEIEPSAPRTAEELLTLSSGVVELLSVAYGGPLVSSHTALVVSTRSVECAVFYPRHEINPEEYTIHDFLIRFDQIQDCFQDVLGKWMNPSAHLRRARQMLISAERRPADFIELRFLPLAHAIEVLSNEAPRTTVIPKEHFTRLSGEMLEAVRSQITDELASAIRESLQWANGRSLRNRLRSLLGELQESTRRLFMSDVEAFVGGIVKTRNHYTHYSSKAGSKLLQGTELHWGIRKLALMLRVCLLVRSGVPEDVVQKAIGGHARLSQERKVWVTVSEEGSEYTGGDF